MNLLLAMALRAQATIDTLAVLKARTPGEVTAERRLQDRLAEVLEPLIEHVHAQVEDRGIPSDPGVAELLIGDTEQLQEALVEVLADELGDEAAEAIAHVEEMVDAAAAKQTPDELRPFGMDRRLFDTVSRLGGRMLGRFTSRTLDTLVGAAETAMPTDQLRKVMGEMLQGELQQLSRHALGDVRNEATEVAERSLGVTHHRWVTAGDADVRPAHEDVDGEVVKVGELFSNGWRRPGGLGCRCHLEPVVQPPVAA